MPCKSSTAQTWLVRILATALVGVAAWYGANVLADVVWHTRLAAPIPVLIAFVPALLTLLATRHAAIFAEDCLEIPTGLAPALRSGGCASGVCARDEAKKKKRTAAAGSSPIRTGAAAAAARAVIARNPEIAAANGTLVLTERISVETADAADSALTITVTTNGISNSRLKLLFTRLEGVSGVRWDNHKNLGNGRKQKVGRLMASADRNQAFTRIQEITGRFS